MSRWSFSKLQSRCSRQLSAPCVPTISASSPSVSRSQGQDVGAYVLQRAERLRLVEVAGEADLVADLDTVRDVPGVRGVGQHLAAEEGFIRLLFMRLNLWSRHFIQPFDARGLWAGWAWQRS